MQEEFKDQQSSSHSDNDKRNLLSIGEASEYLGVSIDTLRRWEKRGRIEPYRSPGGHRHYSKIELDKLFDKKYVRDEPTIRSTGNYKENIPEKPESNYYPTEPQPSNFPSFDNTPTPPSRPIETGENLNTINEYSLPPWRTPTVQESTEVREPKEPIAQPPSYEPVSSVVNFERETRDIKVPETSPIRVIQEEALLTPQEAYFRQQSVSILNPTPAVTDNQLSQASYNTPQIPQAPQVVATPTSESNEKEPGKNLVIYISAGIGILVLAITWYLLWRNSQAVLSPIP